MKKSMLFMSERNTARGWNFAHCIYIFCVYISAAGISCISLAENTGRLLDGSMFAEKKTAQAVQASHPATRITTILKKDKSAALVITSSDFPGLRIYGNAPDGNGHFSLTGLLFTSTSYNGWNEIYYDIYGSAVYSISDGGKNAALHFETPIDIENIAAGNIRHGATRLSGGRALEELRRREERLDALVGWMNASGNQFAEGAKSFDNKDAFAAYWKPVLLPEIHKTKKQPAAYKNIVQENKTNKETKKRYWGEDVLWNGNYTELVFPEYMRRYRNSGALLRDWEEALDWLYLKYIWKSLPHILTS
ncbi:MAG: hypothetical protein LBG74_07815 [Spirochaetaceae bacterium]|jgi:hypothetical protein|nr:hypothetical protein [Spirochaetaceae bacterium]